MLRALSLIFSALIAFPACAQSTDFLSALREGLKVGTITVGPSGSRVQGSGKVTDEVRAVVGFAAMSVDGPIDIELRSGTREQVTVKFDDNLQQLIEVKIIAGAVPTLAIGLAPNAAFKSSHIPKVLVEFVTMNDLTMRGPGDVHADILRGERAAVSMNGSGDLVIDTLDVPLLAVSISGSGDFTAAGKAAQQAYSIRGSGDVSAEKLAGRVVKIQISGSGDAVVNASEKLEIAIAGSGDVSYVGNPTVTRAIAGSGSVKRLH